MVMIYNNYYFTPVIMYQMFYPRIIREFNDEQDDKPMCIWRMNMPKRSTRTQTCHNNSVLRRAAGLRVNGWKVKDDIPYFQRPSVLIGSRPDIKATKAKKRRIIEVETPESKRKDKLQHKNLRNFAKSQKSTQFMMRTCKT